MDLRERGYGPKGVVDLGRKEKVGGNGHRLGGYNGVGGERVEKVERVETVNIGDSRRKSIVREVEISGDVNEGDVEVRGERDRGRGRWAGIFCRSMW